MQIPLSFVGAGNPWVASNRFRSRERRARVRSCVPPGVPERHDLPHVPTPSPLNLHPDDFAQAAAARLVVPQKKKGRTRCPQTIPIAGDES
jgi:hypothetical protein